MAEETFGTKTYTAGEALAVYRRVKLSSASGTQVEYADAGDNFIGVTCAAAASGAPVAVRPFNGNGTYKMVASEAASLGAAAFGAADGKVADTPSGSIIGVFAEAPSGDGSIVEVIPLVQTGDTETKTADYTVTILDNGKTFDTTGASGAVTFAMPAANPGLKFRFRVGAAQELRIDPNGTETIALPSTGVAGAAGKYLTANAAGETVDIQCVVAGTWNVFGYTGTWTAEP